MDFAIQRYGHTGRPTGRQRVAVIALLAVIGLGVVYPAVAAVLSRKDYGTFAFWKVPDRINYCGRSYYDGGPQRGSPSLFASQDSEKGAHWSFLSWTFSGRSIYADVAPLSPPSARCARWCFTSLSVAATGRPTASAAVLDAYPAAYGDTVRTRR